MLRPPFLRFRPSSEIGRSRAREGASAGHTHRENTLRICRWRRRDAGNKLGVPVEGTNDLEPDEDRATLGSRESLQSSP